MKSFCYDESNVFAKILRREVKCKLILENDYSLSFFDINPVASFHALIIPKKPYVDYTDFLENSSNAEKIFIQDLILKLVKKFKFSNYNIRINNGKEAGQEIFHFHYHLLSNDSF